MDEPEGLPEWVEDLADEWHVLANKLHGEGPCRTYREVIAATMLDAARMLRERAEHGGKPP